MWDPCFIFLEVLIEAKYSTNRSLGVFSLLTMFFIFCEEKKKYTFRRLDNVLHTGYYSFFGFDGYTIVC